MDYKVGVVTDIGKAALNSGIGIFESAANLATGEIDPNSWAYVHMGRIDYTHPEYGHVLETTMSMGLLGRGLGIGYQSKRGNAKTSVSANKNRQPSLTDGEMTGGNKPVKLPSNGKINYPISSTSIVETWENTPQSIWGFSAENIAQHFNNAGYQTAITQSTRGSKKAVIVKIQGHKSISQIQVHPGQGRHNGSYYKISTTNNGIIKVVDPATYAKTPEKAKILYK